MILIRFILVSLIFYLLIRSFVRHGKAEDSVKGRSGPEKGDKISSKGVSKKTGEYIDYEEIKN
jgi:hypothetical protein